MVAGALLAIVGLYYYLQIARAMYMVEPKTEVPVVVKPALATAVIICLVAVVGYGAYPRPLLESARVAADALTQQSSTLLANP